MADGNSTGYFDFGHELVVDFFAGGGGASLGITDGYRAPDIAVNHNPVAIAVHRANHPESTTKHYTTDVFELDPIDVTGGRPVGIFWASPDCRHFSKAKGKAPRSKRVRGLAWVVIRWAAKSRPRLIFLENVEEFQKWGPIDDAGRPIKEHEGRTFQAFKLALSTGIPSGHPDLPEILAAIPDVTEAQLVRGLGYRVEFREERAYVQGAPTIRKRLYMVARADGEPIKWFTKSHGKPTDPAVLAGLAKPWRTAADCVDFSIPCPSVHDRKKRLAENTERRIAYGMERHVFDAEHPFIVPMRGTSASHTSTHGTDVPLSTVTGGGTHHGLVVPVLTECANASSPRVFSVGEPLRTQCAQVKGGHFALMAATLMHLTHHGDGHIAPLDGPLATVTGANRGEQALIGATLIQTGYGEREGQDPRVPGLGKPLGTVVAGGVKHGVVQASGVEAAFMLQASGGPNGNKSIGHDARTPVSTITGTGSHQQVVTAYLMKFYKTGGSSDLNEPMHTLPTKDRMAVVQTISIPRGALTEDQWRKAQLTARFLAHYLPHRFPPIEGDALTIIILGDHVLVDIGLRMLTPRELARAMGVPDWYVIERGLFETAPGSGIFVWKKISKTDQVRLIGNMVCKDMAEDLVRENAAELRFIDRRVAA
ncbi:DNA cytosine methyltransferase [Luteibacter aegosomatis]|uniref:DNA cytosine methyltransferase n=1 Tax=Luteibacter aegosomatis TaxID=2911537 RepID=UPI001FF8DA7F|nr:DNA cytosine methyltransferase [Luteibacter aegosomatis]UPG86813.1 DNA cytosine methyltransferase [Luteibacter aegosomatis]